MENGGIKIIVVAFIFMFSLPVKLQNSLKTQGNDSYQVLYISFKGNVLFT